MSSIRDPLVPWKVPKLLVQGMALGVKMRTAEHRALRKVALLPLGTLFTATPTVHSIPSLFSLESNSWTKVSLSCSGFQRHVG